jgi:hypothetical protein
VGRQLIALETEGTYPELCASIDLTAVLQFIVSVSRRMGVPVGIEDSLTRLLASDRLVLNGRLLSLLEGGIQSTERNDETTGF